MENDKITLKDYSDITNVNDQFSSFIIERAFSHESTYLDDSKYKCFDDKFTMDEIREEIRRETDTHIAVYKRGFLDAILLFSK